MTHLCVAIFVDDLARAKRDIALAAEHGADMVELRIDRCADAEGIRQLIAASALPCIVTCRPTWEGGHCELPDQQRIALLDEVALNHAAYMDIELAADRSSAKATQTSRDKRCGLILSSHDFTGRPARLHSILLELDQSPADVAKIVWTARTIRDTLEAFEILQNRRKPTIALCMGEAGLISRVLAKKFGAFLTFASLDPSGGTASGQIPVADMKKLYRWDAIGPATRVYGVVAKPVMHSMSPAIHNAAFDAVGHDGVYLPLLVEAGYESFKAFMETFGNFAGLHLSGLSVTIPHKENALRYLTEKGAQVEPLARTIGAVNTIIIDRSAATPVLRGMNTDYAAILDSITAKLNITRDELAGQRVAVLGAGGTGRTAVAALAHYGADVLVHNRNPERADALAAEFTGHRGPVVSASLNDLLAANCRIFINTTSVGMHPNTGESPIGDRPPPFSPDTVVFDAVYNPMRTRLLAQAESAGAMTIRGIEMFVRQAAAQFQAWTAIPAPTDIMRRIIEARLSEAEA